MSDQAAHHPHHRRFIGLGAALAHEFARHGHELMLVARHGGVLAASPTRSRLREKRVRMLRSTI